MLFLSAFLEFSKFYVQRFYLDIQLRNWGGGMIDDYVLKTWLMIMLIFHAFHLLPLFQIDINTLLCG